MNKFNILLLCFLLTACGNSTSEPKDQQEFKNLVSSLSDEYKEVKDSKNDLEVKDFEKKFNKELKETNRSVSSWIGNFDSSSVDDEGVTIDLTNGDQTYHLILVDPKAIEYSKNFKKDDKILFSGNLGKESSITMTGALREPEFIFYPTKISTVDDKNGVVQDQKIIDDLHKKQEAEEKAFLVKQAVAIQCKAFIKANLRFPESADFSSDEEITELDNKKFIYKSVVNAKNGLGNEIPHRFLCLVQVGDEADPVIKVLKANFLDK
ncbi:MULTISPECIES: hypothetical protein [Acinetobacter calcoaceticus/baumannii complex]|uniref:hypothetical protein n=1 Tax=Acinetobacter calcoaceticus/baumannii complex TaxID=909768 RepID=UPI00259FFFB3|nr:hypothetical protein [Acinetobacter baumannii]